MYGPTLSILSIIWVLSLALFTLRQIRFWAKKRPLAISIEAWLLYVALVYLRTVPYALAAPMRTPPRGPRAAALFRGAPQGRSFLTLASSLTAAR